MAITPANDTLYIKEITLPTGTTYELVDYEARETIDAMTTTITSISSNVNSISVNVNSISSNLSSLSSTVDSVSTNVSSVSARVHSVSSNLNSLSGTVSSVSSNVSSLSSTVNNMSKYTAFLGVVSNSATWTKIQDGSTTATILVGSTTTTVTTGNIVIYKPSNSTSAAQEFIWDGSKWNFFGDISAENLGSLAGKNSATGSHLHITAVNVGTATVTSGGKFTPAGTINTGTGTLTSKGNYTPSGSISFSANSTTNLKITSTTSAPAEANRSKYWNYTPEGTISLTAASAGGSSASVLTEVTGRNLVSSIGTVAPTTSTPSNGVNYTSVTQHNLKLGYITSTSSNAISSTSVANVVKTIGSITGTFQGLQIWAEQFTVTIPSAATFTGTSATISVTGTVINSATFSGTKGDISVTSSAAFVNSVTTTTANVSITVS